MRASRLLLAAAVLSTFAVSARADDGMPGGAPPPAAAPKAAERGYVGILPGPAALLSAEDRKALNVQVETGVVVLRLTPGAPADKAGLKVGDVLLKFAGSDVPDTKGLDLGDPEAALEKFQEAFGKIAGGMKAGSEVEIVVQRDGKPVTLKAVPVERAAIEALDKAAAATTEKPDPEAAARGFLGFTPAPAALLSAKQKAKWNVKAEKGVVAVRVLKDSPAAKAGLKDGDVMLQFAGQDVPATKDLDPAKKQSAEAFGAAWSKIAATVKPGAKVAVVVERDGKPVTLDATSVDLAAIQKVAAASGEDDEEDEGDEGDEGKEGLEKGPEKKAAK